MNVLSAEKVFYNPGDLVILKHELDNKPIMYVVEKVTRSMINKEKEKETIFLGIKCRWFDANLVLREAVFSTKDLTHYLQNMKLNLNVPNINSIEVSNSNEAIEIINKVANTYIEERIKMLDATADQLEMMIEEVMDDKIALHIQRQELEEERKRLEKRDAWQNSQHNDIEKQKKELNRQKEELDQFAEYLAKLMLDQILKETPIKFPNPIEPLWLVDPDQLPKYDKTPGNPIPPFYIGDVPAQLYYTNSTKG